MSDRPRRKLIEVALPLEAINIASAREKAIHTGHPSSLHLWWARRPLATARAVIFASLVDDPSADPDRFPTLKSQEDERRRLFGLIEQLVQWENTGVESVLEDARREIRRSTGGHPPAVLDPFAGGGSIPLEAQRLGLTAYASDLNPVAVLITRAEIDIPSRFSGRPPVHSGARAGVGGTGAWRGAAGLAEDIRRYGTWMNDEARRRAGSMYPTVAAPEGSGSRDATVIAWLWARTVRCPNPACGAAAPLLKSFELETTARRRVWVEPIVDRQDRTVSFRIRHGSGTAPEPTMLRGNGRCVVCSASIPLDHVKAEAMKGRVGHRVVAVVADSRSGRVYVAGDEEQERIALAVQSDWGPAIDMSTHPQYMAPPRYGLSQFRDLFTRRQAAVLETLIGLLDEVEARVARDAEAAGLEGDDQSLSAGGRGALAYAQAIRTYLAFAIDKVANYGTSVCAWNRQRLTLVPTFGLPVVPMVWDYTEANALGDSSGSWHQGFEQIAKIVGLLPGGAPGTSMQADARIVTVPEPVLVSTDPPYYDNVPYADLSDFFYTILRQSLGSTWPDLFSTILVPKSAELVADQARFGGKVAAKEHFEAGLRLTFENLRSQAADGLPITIYYAFRQSESSGDGSIASTGWETMLESLLASGLAVDGTWPMRTEQRGGLREFGRNALASSIVLVCRPRIAAAGITTRKDFVASLKQELPEAMRALQHGNIAPVDLAQASIGPGMAVFSRYAKVLEPDGSAMRVRTALALINQVLDEILAEQEGEFDSDTRWAIAWYEQFGLGESAYGTAETLSKAKNSSVAGLVEAGIVSASRGRVRLLERAEYSGNWDPTKDNRIPVWEATQRLAHLLLTDGEAAAGDLLARLGGLGDTARDLAYRMYHVAERKGWTDEARAYNALVVAWPDLSRGAESARAAQPAQTSLGLE